ncbi:MAG: hypothetical protein AAFP04_10640 [Myxococcota bacterium]
MAISEVRTRWLAFIAKIQERHRDVINEARVGCLQLLDVAQLDTNPMANAWQGVSSQLLALYSKIEDTWSERVEEAFREAYEAEGNDGNYFDELDVGRKAMDELEWNKQQAETEIFAAAADRLMEAAQHDLSKDFGCTQCGAQLEVDRNVFRSHYVKCGFCSVINTYEPGTRVRSVENFCAHHLAKRETLELERTMHFTWETVRAERTAPLALLQHLESAVHSYWSTFYGKRAEIVPDLEKDRDADLNARMQEFYNTMKHEKNWLARA